MKDVPSTLTVLTASGVDFFRHESVKLPLNAALVALALGEDGCFVRVDEPQDGLIAVWRKSHGIVHAFSIPGRHYERISLSMLLACRPYGDFTEAHRERLHQLNKRMMQIHNSNEKSAIDCKKVLTNADA